MKITKEMAQRIIDRPKGKSGRPLTESQEIAMHHRLVGRCKDKGDCCKTPHCQIHCLTCH